MNEQLSSVSSSNTEIFLLSLGKLMAAGDHHLQQGQQTATKNRARSISTTGVCQNNLAISLLKLFETAHLRASSLLHGMSKKDFWNECKSLLFVSHDERAYFH